MENLLGNIALNSGRSAVIERSSPDRNGGTTRSAEHLQRQLEKQQATDRELSRESSGAIKNKHALKRANEAWKRAFDSVPDLIAIIDNQYRILRVNEAMARRLGVSPDACAGCLCYEVVHGASCPPEFCPHWRTCADGREHTVELHEKRLGGDFLVTTTPLLGKKGERIGAVHIARDITGQKRTEKALRESEERVRLKLESILTPDGDMSALDLEDFIDIGEFQSLMNDFYKLTRIPIGLIDIKGKVLAQVGWQEICTRFHRNHPETLRHCIESDLRLTSDIPEGEYRLYRCLNGLWDSATPIMVDSNHLGNLFTGQFFFDDELPDYEAFRANAERYGFPEKEYLAALEAAPRVGRAYIDTVMTYFMKLAAMISRLSYSNTKLARALTERDILTGALKELNENLESRVEDRTRNLAELVVSLKREIVERKKARESVLRLNRLYRALSEINQAIVRIHDRDTLFRDFCRIAVEEGGFKLAWIGLINGESNELRITAAFGATEYLDKVVIPIDERTAGAEPVGVVLREGGYHICNDLLSAPITRRWHERSLFHCMRSSASIALKQEGKVIGSLTLYADKKNFFDSQQIELLRQMGTDISFAIDNIIRKIRHQEAEQALHGETVERLRAVEALREKEQLLLNQSRQAAMGEMIGNIAHQWRQPLNMLGITVQGLLLLYDHDEFSREILEEGVRKSMELIKHMSGTIDDFRNYFKPDKKKSEFRVAEAMETTLSLVRDSFKNQRISIEVDTEGDPVIFGYRNEFAQALLNILNNAIDAFSERKIANPVVRINIGTAGNRSLVIISDNAGGIPEEIKDRIFDPYFTTKGPQRGTGVGLFMSRAIIEKNMGGTVAAYNINNGAQFRIEV